MKKSVYDIFPIHPDEAFSCYLLRVATNELVPGVRGLVDPLSMGSSNAAINRGIEQIAQFVRQPLAALTAAQVCLHPTQLVLREKIARMTGHAFCPHCVAESSYFRSAWRHSLVTACVKHRVQLVDSCPSCSQLIQLHRENLFFCPCGQELAAIATRPAESEMIWAAAGIEGVKHTELDWPSFGNTNSEQWVGFDELLYLSGYYNSSEGVEMHSRRRGEKLMTVTQSQEFLQVACANFASFPTQFEKEVEQRLACGDKSKAGLASRLGPWFRSFRKLTQDGFSELRLAFACCVAEHLMGMIQKISG